jgi:CubicO group peptidase (beta-lactamase class C family)
MSTAALMQQQEQGTFGLDDAVNRYLTDIEIRGEDPRNPVTFRHLLSHTSGLPAAFGGHPVWGDTVPLSLLDYLRSSLAVQGPPLEKLVYSNLAFTLVGYLVEKLSGHPYREYVGQNIFDAAEMKSTSFAPTPAMEERLAFPYAPNENTGRLEAVPRLKANVWPAGIVWGTVTDQANWLIVNLNGGDFKGRRILQPRTIAEMHTRQFDTFTGPMSYGFGNETTGYGLAWIVTEMEGERTIAHSGSVTGYTAFLFGNVDRKIGFAILTNGNRSHRYISKLAVDAVELLKANGGGPVN